MTAGIYPVAEYPRSDSWMVCAKAAGRDVMVPVPRWTLVGGYNEHMHRAAFVLPQSGHAILEDGWNMLPLFGRAARVGAEGKEGGDKEEEVAWERVFGEAGISCAIG
jgi:hypothetical protein